MPHIRSTRPVLNPALAALWRDRDVLQLGADPAGAVVLDGVTPARAAFLASLDGSRTHDEALKTATAHGLTADDAARLLDLLAEAGVLTDSGGDHRPLTSLSTTERDRLAPDLAAWACSHPRHPERSATAVLGRRRAATVAVEGAGRVGATLVGLLAAAGVGSVVVTDPRPLRARDLAPGGAHSTTLRLPRAEAACRAARATAPALRTSPPPGRPADLHVLCPDTPSIPPAQRDALVVAGAAHLLATTYESVGVVGPLVLPGRTPCLRCLDLHRVDRDRGWPLVAAQLSGTPRRLGGQPAAPACDVVLATAVAAHAAIAALAYVDDPTAGLDLAGASIELRPPLGRTRCRRWGVHPSCGCSWPSGPVADAG